METHSTSQPAVSQPIVRIEDVTKSYSGRVAVESLSLTLNAGEVFAFLGPNGAGKTTTLKLTTGLLRPDSGSIHVCGYSMQTDGQRARQLLAYVPDMPFLYEKLTGREFITFTQQMYGVPGAIAKARLAELRQRLQLDGYLDQLAETYSHGTKQKVALAAALIHDPTLLIVDEPMVGLDPRTTRVIKGIFRETASRGGAVFMSTHTLDIAEQLADRIGIIHRGRLVACGTLAELQRQSAIDGRLEDIFLKLTDESDGDEVNTGGGL